MVGVADQNTVRAVKLFGEYHSHQWMRQRQLAQRPTLLAVMKHPGVQTIRAAAQPLPAIPRQDLD